MRGVGGGGAVSMPSEWPITGVEDKACPSLSPARRTRSSLGNLNGSAKDSSPVNVIPPPLHLSLRPQLSALLSAHAWPPHQHLCCRVQVKRGSRLGSTSMEPGATRSPQLAELQIEDSAREESSKSTPSPAKSGSPVRRASWALRSVVNPSSAERRAAQLLTRTCPLNPLPSPRSWP